MRTESLRELASFFVRFLRKGGAIAYAACCFPRRAAAACGCPGSASARRQPRLAIPTSRGGGVRSAAAPGAPQVCGQPHARGAVSGGSGRRGIVRSGPVACPAPQYRSPRRERRRRAMSSCSLAPELLSLGLCGPGTLDSIREVCLREVWPLLPSFLILRNPTLSSHARHHKTHELTTSTRLRLLLHAQGTLFNRATAASILT